MRIVTKGRNTYTGFAAGVALLAALQKRLGEAEQKVEVLMGQLAGEKDDELRDTTLS